MAKTQIIHIDIYKRNGTQGSREQKWRRIDESVHGLQTDRHYSGTPVCLGPNRACAEDCRALSSPGCHPSLRLWLSVCILWLQLTDCVQMSLGRGKKQCRKIHKSLFKRIKTVRLHNYAPFKCKYFILHILLIC